MGELKHDLVEILRDRDWPTDVRGEAATEIERLREDVRGYDECLKHRDAWRQYAYGKRERPGDFLGMKPCVGPTEIDRLREQLAVRPRGDGITHWSECWKAYRHHDCALVEIERLNSVIRSAIAVADGGTFDSLEADMAELLAVLR